MCVALPDVERRGGQVGGIRTIPPEEVVDQPTEGRRSTVEHGRDHLVLVVRAAQPGAQDRRREGHERDSQHQIEEVQPAESVSGVGEGRQHDAMIRPVDPDEHETEKERKVTRPLLAQQSKQSQAGIGVGLMWNADRQDQKRDREREYAVAEGPDASQARILYGCNLNVDLFINGRWLGWRRPLRSFF